jgi:hypothetical protein
MSEQKKKIHLLPFLHVLAMLAIAVWWGAYFWHHTWNNSSNIAEKRSR